MDPSTELCVMDGLPNTLRRLVIDGRPVVTGPHPVGDTVCMTNSTWLMMRAAADRLEVLDAHSDDPTTQDRDSKLVARVRGVLACRDGPPRMPQPTPEQLATALKPVPVQPT